MDMEKLAMDSLGIKPTTKEKTVNWCKRNVTFEEFLMEEFCRIAASCLYDDQMSDAFDNWVGERPADEMIEYAKAWGLMIETRLREEFKEALTEIEAETISRRIDEFKKGGNHGR